MTQFINIPSVCQQLALYELREMHEQLQTDHPNSAHIALNMAALASQVATELTGEDQGDFVLRVLWQYPHVAQAIADTLHIPAAFLRSMAGV